MLSLHGIYDKRQLILNETPMINKPVKVIVTFLEEIDIPPSQKTEYDKNYWKSNFSELIDNISKLSSGGNSVDDVRKERER